MLDRLRNFDPLSAARQNELLDQVNVRGLPGASQSAQYGAAGVTFNGPPATRWALFQLTGELVYPNLAGAGTEHFTVEPTPYATARMVCCHQFDPDDKDPQEHPIRSYGGSSLSKQETVYHPGAFRNTAGYAIGHPAFRSGDRVFCVFNRQSGRWEIVAAALGTWRFELKTGLSPGGSATAYLLPWHDAAYGVDTNVEFTVYDAILGTLRGRARTETVAGSRGYARYMPDSGRWEITAIEQKARWIRFALAADMGYQTPNALASVLTYWDGSNPTPTGANLTVQNCPATGQYLFSGLSGNIGLACYDVAYDQYRIVQLECPT